MTYLFFLPLLILVALCLQAVVLACGDGRRLYPLTQDCPAPLLPVLNKPLLHYQLELLEKAGYSGVVRDERSFVAFSRTSTISYELIRVLIVRGVSSF